MPSSCQVTFFGTDKISKGDITLKTKLFHKNTYLGLLMTFVLAFGVQDVKAIMLPSAQTEIEALSSNLEVGSSINTYSISLNSPRVRESVRITAPDGGIQFTVGGVRASSLTLTEKNADGTAQPAIQAAPGTGGVFYSGATALPASVTVGGYFTSTGRKRITITDTTPARTTDPIYTKQATVTYTFYVVKSVSPTDSISFSLTRGGTRLNSQGYITRVDGRSDFYIYSGSNDYPVTYALSSFPSTNPEPNSTTPSLYVKGVSGNIALSDLAQPISSRIRVWLDANGSSGTDISAPENYEPGITNVVTATISSDHVFKGAYIFGTPTLDITLDPTTGIPGVADVTEVDDDATSTYKFMNGTQGQSAGTITATVMDGAAAPVAIPDVLVKFDLADKTVRGGYLTDVGLVGLIVSNTNRMLTSPPSLARTLHVRTDSSMAGIATVTYEFGTIGQQRITVTTVGLSGQEVRAELAAAGVLSKNIAIDTNQRQSGTTRKFDLIAVVTDDGDPEDGEVVTFRTNNGELTRVSAAPSSGAINNVQGVVNVVTNDLGEAHVVYDLGDNTGRQEIHASIDDGTDEFQEITFVINGGAAPSVRGDDDDDDDDDDEPATTRGSLNIAVSGSGTTRTVRVTAVENGTSRNGIFVRLSVSDGATFSPTSGPTPLESTLTLPQRADTYTVTATTAADYESDSEDITVTLPGTLAITLVGDQVNGAQTIQITARNAAGALETTAVQVRLSGAGISRTVPVTGTQRVPITLPTTSGTLTASAAEYNSGSIALPARASGTTTTTTTTPTGQAGAATSIEIDGSRSRDGVLAEAMQLRVRVLDANDNGVSEVPVTFQVLAPGRGSFAGARGSGRAIRVETARNGYASTSFTPTTEGDVIVRVSANGVAVRLTFLIDVAGSTDDDDAPAPATDEDETPRTTEIDPEVHVNASNRPPMLWVDGGAIYALVGADVEKFAPSVDNALNVAVGGGKVYWTEQTGESSGTINSANLNGSGMKELKSIRAVPMGIAVDTDAEKLYWTNSRGRIQSMDADGGRINSVVEDLSGPMDIAVARGNLYWTQYDETAGEGNVGIVNPTSGNPRYISTDSDMPMSLVIGGNKVYWTERTGTDSGTINSANLNGNGAEELNDIRAVPSGIAVDEARSKLYWTNSRGRIQSADLDGSGIRKVVDGLGAPGDMVLSNSITAPVAGGTESGSETTASNKYDVNGDGTVDSKDSDALVVAVAAGITDDKYDVNGDGKVDVMDIVAVAANRDNGAAGAPSLVGNVNLSAVQIDRLQEQIDLLIATGDRSPVAIKTLIYLQQLIATARPEKTQLFANFPNPFNPETWIPYELATDTDVRITIYSAQGVVIRTLQLGQQSAGYYTDRERAAYWDGRNAFGEQVASGVYFYQLETDTMSALRKMVILK